MEKQRHYPVEMILHRKQRMLELLFDDDARFKLPCEYLRVYSPSALVQGHHHVGAVLQLGKEDVNITEMKQIGHYAVKIFFDDKHKSGLFTWNYLYDLGENYEARWEDYLDRLQLAGHQRKEAS
ncbi:MAG: gamma-butyrobetaine hydroxylase-like domain-containing protein [Pseudomonadota bacterium]